ncbi:MAG: KPN_02809 family neutral zinc metallopeptidase [Myxococcales bacterium]
MQLGGDGDRSNVEDRRGLITGGRLGLGGILILGVLSIVFRQNLFALVGDPGAATQAQGPHAEERRQAEAPLEKVAVATFNDAQKVWGEKLAGYREAKLVLFWDQTDSGCGGAGAAMGPFYCPADQRVYIDLGFYRELARRFGAPGDFAQAYVIAHEVGHHVQALLGITGKVERAVQRDPSQRNALSVRVELQAVCLAGVWGHSAAQRQLLDPGDVEEGLRAAAAVGDDRIQQMSGRRVSPESFTHGTAAERARWFRTGLASGSVDSCETFPR